MIILVTIEFSSELISLSSDGILYSLCVCVCVCVYVRVYKCVYVCVWCAHVYVVQTCQWHNEYT